MSTGQFNYRLVDQMLRGTNRRMQKAEFAKQMDVTPNTVSRWVSGAVQPNEKTVRRMAKILEVNFSELWLSEPESMQDFYEARLRELIASQPEHVKARILAMVAEELASRGHEESGEAEGKKDGK